MKTRKKMKRWRLRISDTAYKRLTAFNSLVFLFLFIIAFVGAVIKKDAIIYRLNDLLEHEKLTSKVVSLGRTLGSKVKPSSKFPLYKLAVDPKYLRIIEQFVQNSLKGEGILLKKDKKWYPARFSHNGETYKVKVRIRGDLSNHWRESKKSLRIKFNKERLFNGYRSINLIIPSDKEYEIEPVGLEKSRSMGLLVADDGFAMVTLNQVDMGLYYWFEQPGKEMLERLRYPEGEMFISDGIWLDTRANRVGVVKGWDSYPSSFQVSIHKKGGTAAGMIQSRWDRLLQLSRTATRQEFSAAIPYLIDIDKFAKWNALIWFFGGTHPASPDNVRWYYDPTSGLFEPITYDLIINEIFRKYRKNGSFDHLGDARRFANPLIERILEDRNVTRLRNRYIYEILEDGADKMTKSLEDLYADIRDALGQGIRPYRLESMDELHDIRMNIFKENIRILRTWLEYGRVFIDTTISNDGKDAEIRFDVYPDSLVDLNLHRIDLTPTAAFPNGLKINGVRLTDPEGKQTELTSFKATAGTDRITLEFEKLAIWTNRDKRLRPVVTRWTLSVGFEGGGRFQGGAYPLVDMDFIHSLTNRPIESFRTRRSPAKYVSGNTSNRNPDRLLETFLKESPLPFRREGGRLILAPGTYKVERDIVIPGRFGLVLEAGVVLKMAPKASILVYRAVQILGENGKPVIVEPLIEGRPWGVLGVTKAREQSRVLHLIIRGGSERWINGIYFSGQLNFYHSPVRISNSVIENSAAADGLNIKHADFEITDSRFVGNASDAFDGDWVKGVIRNSTIKDNGGDGVDFCGSEVVVVDSIFSGMDDKAISVGEKTTLHAVNNLIATSGIGIASKDLSSTHVYGGAFYNNERALSAYRKKPVFGGGTANVMGSLFWRNKKDFEVDGVSSIRLNGVGLYKAPAQSGIEIADLRLGRIESFYENDENGVPSFKGGAGEERGVFAKGPETGELTILGVTIPNLAKSPVGMIRPLVNGR